jgi:uncharacterized protein YnzC (UPF0291/DUF896 family)
LSQERKFVHNDAEDVFDLLDYHGQDFTLDHLDEIRKQKRS